MKSDLFNEEGRHRLDAAQDTLFPPTVRPAFLRLLWIALALLTAAGFLLVVRRAG